MKKLLLASAIAALSISTVQAAPTIYGKAFVTADYIDAEMDYESSAVKDKDGDSLQLNSNGSRIGFKGSEPITENTDVIYKLEYGIDIDGDKSDTFTRRTTFLGLKNNSFGELRFGNQSSPIDEINNITVTNGYWDNLGTNNEEPTLAQALTMADSSRIKNSVMWVSPQLADLPLQVTAMYGADEVFETDGVDRDNGYGASIMFDQGTGFTAGLAYDDDLEIVGDVIRGTVSYDASELTGTPITIGAMYQEADYDETSEDETGFVISAEMGLSNFAKPATVYAQYNNVSDLGGYKGLDSDQFVLGGKYMYQKNMIAHLYAGYNNTEGYSASTKTDAEGDLFAIGGGLEYKF